MSQLNKLWIWFVVLVSTVYLAANSVFQNRSVVPAVSCWTASQIVVIDAGHGGEDGGAVSITGEKESTINLSVAKRLEQMLAFSGVKICMVRSDENAVHTEGNTIRQRKISDLKNRVRMINDLDNAVLISIHQNHFSDQRYYGPQVFYANTPGSKEFAKNMQQALSGALNPAVSRKPSEVKSSYLMNNISTTGILIECGFLSNANEAVLLEDETYQKKIVGTIASSVAQYLKQGSGDFEI